MVLNQVMELGSMEAIKEMVKLGLGISILAPWIARKELGAGELADHCVGRQFVQGSHEASLRGAAVSPFEKTVHNDARRADKSDALEGPISAQRPRQRRQIRCRQAWRWRRDKNNERPLEPVVKQLTPFGGFLGP